MENTRYHAVCARKRIRNRRIKAFTRLFIILLCIALVIVGLKHFKRSSERAEIRRQLSTMQEIAIPDWVDVELIKKHGSARSGIKLTAINNIVIHYVGNAGTTALNNRNYFNQDSTEVSSHFVVGLDGEVVQCVPLTEKSAASNWRNADTIAIEVCHPDESGKFNSKTYDSVIRLTAWLCNATGLTEKDVIRHYDITGKRCPLYYVDNTDEWEQLKKDVGEALNGLKT